MSKATQDSTSNYHNEHVMRWHWQNLKAKHAASQGKQPNKRRSGGA